MSVEILLALVASVFTATSSVAQRVAAAPAPGELSFSWRLVRYLLRRPVWFLGILCMIAGFLFQLAALHFGDLSLVQPIIATELLFVFTYLALRNHKLVHARDWLAAAGMALGLGGFLLLADPSGGSTTEATAWMWILAAACTFGAAGLVAALSVVPLRSGRGPSPARKAALLSVSAGIAWGFVAAVIKELSSHVDQGLYAVLSNWSPYVLVLSGAAAMFLVSNAFQAGPLAASQPGLTIVDPLVASLLGVTLFGEHIRYSPLHLAGEVVAVVVLVASVVLLSRSPLIKEGQAADALPAPGRPVPPSTPPAHDATRTGSDS
ncbi:MAG TPA: DMT family transporter [Acidimicrobiales bacterium]|nr:DMT family transporter [Acidimicrobiales bacterium]